MYISIHVCIYIYYTYYVETHHDKHRSLPWTPFCVCGNGGVNRIVAPSVGVVGHKGHELFTERQHNGAKDGLGTATGIDTVSRQ